MTADLASKLIPFGIDYADAIDRFDGNAALYERLAVKYLSDTRFASLMAALEVDDFDEAYRQAHTLKGVAGNLSLSDLYRTAAFISDALKNGEPALAKSRLPQLERAHHQAIKGLELLRDKAL
ncbi:MULTISPECIES: Hpt domain-containing protein [unclassified Adlercreutzia]|uniref:Hpt domain-containing protein n=1 Tax=unclassified Adlercreutzia TaxID=2636013 RepID=UPI0013EE1972|nr:MULTISPECIES: Hpt domain-containing protein [unclassified Adlercreutzia]